MDLDFGLYRADSPLSLNFLLGGGVLGCHALSLAASQIGSGPKVYNRVFAKIMKNLCFNYLVI